MPYSGVDDPDLPENVKKLSAKLRKMWVAIWNSAYDKCISDGGDKSDCETSAFKQANGVIKKQKEDMKGGLILDVKGIVQKLRLFVTRKIKKVDSWDGSASNYDSAEAYCNACLINVNDGSPADWTKALCLLPVREQGDSKDTYVDKAVHAAAGSHGIQGVKKPDGVDQAKWDAAVKAAANKIISAYNEMDETCPDAVYEKAGKAPPEKRATSINAIYNSIWDEISKKDQYAFLQDLVVEDDGSLSAIVFSEGKLFKAPLTIDQDMVSVGDWTEVKVDYPPVQQSRFSIHRMPNGQVRWFSVSGSCVLNRSGQIDSRQLFDSFVQHIEETGEYPVRRFCHLDGDEFIIGQCDFVARDENLLITSGIFADSDLAKRAVASLEAIPDYWGESIGFVAEEYQMVELVKDVSVPVFTKGIMRETSSVPEVYAAAWFTTTTQMNEEVQQMLDKRAKEALVKLFDGDEAAADKWLSDNVDPANRMIADSGMVTRIADATRVNDAVQTTEPAPAAPAAEPAPPADAVTQAAPAASQPPVVELDDATVDAIISRLMERQADEVQALKDALAALTDRVAALEKAASDKTGTKEMTDRIAELEKRMDAAKNKNWLDDLPIASTLRATYRPREGAPADGAPPAPPAPQTSADIAGNTLAAVKASLSKK